MLIAAMWFLLLFQSPGISTWLFVGGNVFLPVVALHIHMQPELCWCLIQAFLGGCLFLEIEHIYLHIVVGLNGALSQQMIYVVLWVIPQFGRLRLWSPCCGVHMPSKCVAHEFLFLSPVLFATRHCDRNVLLYCVYY